MLEVATARAGERLIVALRGELDLGTRDRLTLAVADALTDEVQVIELEMEAVSFCDSAGLASIVGLHHAAGAEGKVLQLRGVRRSLRRILEITGLTYLMEGSVPT